MNRLTWLVLYLLATPLASATDTENRVDALIREQERNNSRKMAPSQSFVLGTTELRVDNPGQASTTPTAQPSSEPSQATVTLHQPVHENAALNYRNQFGSQKTEGLPFSSNENSYQLDRKEIWSLDWTRSTWDGKAYTETSSAGDNEQLFSPRQTAHGVQTGTRLASGTGLSAELRQENDLEAFGSLERNIYQTKLSQSLGHLPFTFEFQPALQSENGPGGGPRSQATRLDHALRWQATPQTKVIVGSGVNAKEYSNSTREETLLYYSQLDTVLEKDLTFSLRSDFQDLTRSSVGLPSYQEQRVNIQIGPRFRLPDNFTAALDMRCGFSQENGSNSQGQSEQAVALSIQGKF